MKKKFVVIISLILILVSLLPLILKHKTTAAFPQNTYCNVNFQHPIYEFKDSSGNSIFVLDENGNLYLNGTKVLLNQTSGITQPKTGFGLQVNSQFYWAFNNTNVNIHGEILQKQTIPNKPGDNDIIFRNPVTKEPLAIFDGATGDLKIKGLVIYNGYYNGMSVNDNAFNSNCTTNDNYNSSTGTDYYQDYYCDRINCVYRNIDLDLSQQLCEGNHHNWNIGGNINATKCCEDDPGEYKLTKQCNSGCTSDNSDDACCDDNNDAVNRSTCYPEGSKICSPDNHNYVIESNSGKWNIFYNCTKQCSDSCNAFTTCSNGNCALPNPVALGNHCTSGSGEIAGICNSNYACSNANGNMIYNNGGNLSCQATCGDNNGECNHATNCIDCSQPGSVNGCACACGGYGVQESSENGNCNDNIDNDCDGNIDVQDPDCKKLDGSSCSSNSECLNGYCVDGYCCNEACDGACEACDVSSHVGTCTALGNGVFDNLCSPCKVCNGVEKGSCSQDASNNHWGDNVYGCVGANKRCYNGVCETCGGWLHEDGCSGCAGQGSTACWYRGGDQEICTSVCNSHGGCVSSNWNDDSVCDVCKHYVSSASCSVSSEAGAPKIWNNQQCSFRGDGNNQDCGADPGGARTRFCICNY